MRNNTLLFVVLSLLFSCSKPQPDFTYEVDKEDPLKYTFTSTSENYNTLEWYINGSYASSYEKFDYSFYTGGFYNVELVARKNGIIVTKFEEIDTQLPIKLQVESVTINDFINAWSYDWRNSNDWYNSKEDNSVGPDFTLLVSSDKIDNTYGVYSELYTSNTDILVSDLPLVLEPNLYATEGSFVLSGRSSTSFKVYIYIVDIDDDDVHEDDRIVYSFEASSEGVNIFGLQEKYPNSIQVDDNFRGVSYSINLKWI